MQHEISKEDFFFREAIKKQSKTSCAEAAYSKNKIYSSFRFMLFFPLASLLFAKLFKQF